MFSWASSDPQTPDGPQIPDRNGAGISRFASAAPPFREILPTPLQYSEVHMLHIFVTNNM